MEERVILVDENDREIGSAEKLQAHREGQLHRAFSIFVFNSEGKLLLQKRANAKYHSGGLWTNTCCSHPRPGADLLQEAARKLQEEMGFVCDLKFVFDFRYRAELDNHLFEHEIDHVFVGTFDGIPEPNPHEVEQWKWMDMRELARELNEHPELYTFWLRVIFPRLNGFR